MDDNFPPNPPFNVPKGKSFVEIAKEAQASDYLATAIITVSRKALTVGRVGC